jgi:glycine cleavage system H protein
MSQDQVFAIGKHRAPLPGTLLYAATNHLWAKRADGSGIEMGPGVWRFGFTSYAIALMKDVYFLDWSFGAGMPVTHLAELGHIETSKAESDLYCPATGTLTRINEVLLEDPSAINTDGYGEGWLYEIDCPQAPNHLIDAAAYLKHLVDNWEHTQRVLKGGINSIVDEEDNGGDDNP